MIFQNPQLLFNFKYIYVQTKSINKNYIMYIIYIHNIYRLSTFIRFTEIRNYLQDSYTYIYVYGNTTTHI